MRQIDLIVIHCADTPADMEIGAADIRKWHVEDNGWSDIGYHYVIRRSGVTEAGRPLDKAGAHVRGHNANSIGVCLVGGKGRANLTHKQWSALYSLVTALTDRSPNAELVGHCDLDSAKTCPNFDVKAWWG